MRRKCFLAKCIEASGLRVALEDVIEVPGLEFLEPCAKRRKLIGRQLRHSLLYLFKSRHSGQDIIGPRRLSSLVKPQAVS